MTKTVDVVA